MSAGISAAVRGGVSTQISVNWKDVAHFLQWEGSVDELRQALLDKTDSGPTRTIGFTGWRTIASVTGRVVELVPGPVLAGYGENLSQSYRHLAQRLREMADQVEEQGRES